MGRYTSCLSMVIESALRIFITESLTLCFAFACLGYLIERKLLILPKNRLPVFGALWFSAKRLIIRELYFIQLRAISSLIGIDGSNQFLWKGYQKKTKIENSTLRMRRRLWR